MRITLETSTTEDLYRESDDFDVSTNTELDEASLERQAEERNGYLLEDGNDYLDERYDYLVEAFLEQEKMRGLYDELVQAGSSEDQEMMADPVV